MGWSVVKPLNKGELDDKMEQNDFEGKVYRELYKLITENSKNKIRQTASVKNSAGYYLWNVWDGKIFNLPKLITGSQGTLGIITEITFKLVSVKPVSKLLVIFLRFATGGKISE